MTTLDCDVAVIGAGTAGLAAERHARAAGATTLLIDPVFAGTTCATVGCMPAKLLVAAGDAAHSVRHARAFGLTTEMNVDGPAVMQRLRTERDRFVAGVQKSIEDIPEANRITARARFAAPGMLRLDDGRKVAARAVVIATGARPAMPDAFVDLQDLILTNETLFDRDTLPGSVAVIGAGPLGIEAAQALARLGICVEVFDLGDRVAGLADRKVSDRAHSLLEAEMPIHLGEEPEVERGSDGVEVSVGGTARSFECLLLAAGRPPALEDLDLDAAGLAFEGDGIPVFDRETLQCGRAPVFIAGDANGDRPVLHEAAHEGSIAGQNAAAFPNLDRFQRHVPLAITFTRPECATLGTIPDPDDTTFATAEADYDNQGRTRVEARAGGLCHLYAHRDDGRLAGASLCAPHAGHLAHLLAWAIEGELTVADILSMPFYHPTFEEGIKPALRRLCRETGLDPDRSRGDDAPCP